MTSQKEFQIRMQWCIKYLFDSFTSDITYAINVTAYSFFVVICCVNVVEQYSLPKSQTKPIYIGTKEENNVIISIVINHSVLRWKV